MYTLEKIKEHIAEKINKALGDISIQAPDLVYPSNSEFGDLSLPGFVLTEKKKLPPGKAVADLVNKLSSDDIITKISATGPYLNFSINKKYLTENVLLEITKQADEYGRNKNGQGEKVMIEYSNVNTHKEYHIGHLRNIIYGDAVYRLLLANGYKTIPVSYINDFGIHVAKTIWNYQAFVSKSAGQEEVNKMSEEDRGSLLGKMYVDAVKRADEDPMAKQMIGGIMKEIESRKGNAYKDWKETRQWSIKYFAEIYKELGIEFKNIFYESEVIAKGIKMVQGLLKKGILEKSDGAVLAQLGDLGPLLFLRSDGTALYPVADIPLAVEKFKKYKIKKSIYVVDVRQGLYFKQLFAVLHKMGYKQEMIHLSHDFVKLPSGMMSSRSGNVITYQELKEKMLSKIIKETTTRHKDWDKEKTNEVAEKIALGAMKFEMIKINPNNIINFDIDKALSVDGYTSAYLQYTYARMQSILRKSKVSALPAGRKSQKVKVSYEELKEERENNLISKLGKYPEAVARAGREYDPAEAAKYLFELAQSLNDYYHAVPVLKADDDITRNARLALLTAVSQVIKNGLGLLGIEVVEEM